MTRFCLFVAAVAVIYIGGFVYEQVGPVFYAVIVTLIASTPLLLKISFWKKILLMVPLLVLRVIGKVFLKVFGKNALSRVLAKYGLLEQRFNRMFETIAQSKDHGIDRWRCLARSTQAYLLLIFFPVAVVIFVLALVIKIVRLRFMQFIIEKLMQSILMKWTSKESGDSANYGSLNKTGITPLSWASLIPLSAMNASTKHPLSNKDFSSRLTSAGTFV